MKKTILTVNDPYLSPAFTAFCSYITRLTRSRHLEFNIREPGHCCATCEHMGSVAANEQGRPHHADLNEDVVGNSSANVTVCDKWTDVIEQLKLESRYADLLIIDPATSFKHKYEDLPTSFVKEALTISECPVVIAPQFFDDVTDVVFCYDGSASSVFAIKQFTYLFPEYGDKKAIVLHFNEPREAIRDDTKSKIETWLKPHFSSVNFQVLGGSVKTSMTDYFSGKEKLFVVMGAYGRNLLSSFFRKSAANRIISLIDLPLFITHH